MLKSRIALALCASAALVVAGCSGDDESGEGADGGQQTASAPASDDADQQTGDGGEGEGSGGDKGDNATSAPTEGGDDATGEPTQGESEEPVEQIDLEPSDTTRLERVKRITHEGLTPKSIVANGKGKLITNNMMYSHTVGVYDAKTMDVEEVISDEVNMDDFDIEGTGGTAEGSPVEAAFTKDGKYAYISNYRMYGKGWNGAPARDHCRKGEGIAASAVYRMDMDTLKVDQVIKVGAVPKFLAVSPDQKTLLVSNWCDFELGVVDLEKGEQVDSIDIGPQPRGIAIEDDNKTAWVTAMYGNKLFKVDYKAGTAKLVRQTGSLPRHLNLSPDGKYVYLTTSSANTIDKIDTETDEIVATATPGKQPRSVTMSPDGKALYVVNYNESSMSKVRTSDMKVLQKVDVEYHPIGIAYEPTTGTVWVANYGGSLIVFDDTKKADGDE